MNNIYNTKCISLDEYKRRKINQKNESDLDLIRELYLNDTSNNKIAKILNITEEKVEKEVALIKVEGIKDVANKLNKIFRGF